MKTSKCTHKTCDHCKNLSNPPNYSEDEYDYLAKGRLCLIEDEKYFLFACPV